MAKITIIEIKIMMKRFFLFFNFSIFFFLFKGKALKMVLFKKVKAFMIFIMQLLNVKSITPNVKIEKFPFKKKI